MAVRIIKKSWWVDFRANHQRYRKRSPENTRAGAQAYEATLRQKLARGESLDNERDDNKLLTFEQFARTWFEDYVMPNNKYLEQRMKRYTLNSSLVPFFGKLQLSEVTTHHVEQYKAHELRCGASRKTVNNRLAILGKCLRTAHDWGKLSGQLPKIALLKCPPPKTEFLSADECELLLAETGGTFRDMILFTLRTGMRQGEVSGLQWSSIDWQNRNITVRHSLNDRTGKLETPKSNRERHIPMHPDVYELLFKRKQAVGHVFYDESGKPYYNERLRRKLRGTCERVGLRHVTWHTFRHTFASHLAMRGVPLNTVQMLLGHSTITMTMRYAHVAPSTLRQAIEMLGPKSFTGDFGQPVGNQWLAAQHAEPLCESVVSKKA